MRIYHAHFGNGATIEVPRNWGFFAAWDGYNVRVQSAFKIHNQLLFSTGNSIVSFVDETHLKAVDASDIDIVYFY